MTPLSFLGPRARRLSLWALLVPLAVGPLQPSTATAHCDTLDGPVVTAARDALQRADVSPALVWVRKADEPEVRYAFERALAVRRLSAQARDVADLYFFETVVRVHRAGEGEPFEGLKPAGSDLGPAIPAADRALESGGLDTLLALLSDEMRAGLLERFHAARAARHHPKGDVEAGRRYVATYTAFVHYVEQLYRAANPGEAKGDEHLRAPGHHP